ncbi:hypothetical protein A2U01_0062584, partial [Trifolium medium]|nr:hypothetical protein [Trifolium medium]
PGCSAYDQKACPRRPGILESSVSFLVES